MGYIVPGASLHVAAQTTQAQPDKKSKRDERREKRKLEKEQKEAAAKSDTAAKRKGVFKRIFGKKETYARQDSAFAKDSTRKRGFLSNIFGKKEGGRSATAEERTARINAQVATMVKPNSAVANRLKAYEDEMAKAFEEKNEEQMMEYMARYQSLRDSLVTEQVQRQELEQEAELSRTVSYSVGAGLILSLALAGALFIGFTQKRRSNILLSDKNHKLGEAYEEISAQKEELHAMNEDLAEKNHDIMDSITYARRIQEAILPDRSQLKAALPDSFVLYMPRDIVSGDFYWFFQTPSQTFIAAVDCTGHGVPGAFMSVLGMSLLNQIVIASPNIEPGEVLNQLHAGVMRSLKQQGAQAGSGTQQDGMDIGLCSLNAERSQLKYAGANNPFYLIREGALIETKADKAPIGGTRYADYRFTTHTLDLKAGDLFYLFSDGFADQFGGDKGRKFTYKRLQEFLLEIVGLPMAEQQERLAQVFQQWCGEKYNQIDDVLILGVKC